MNVYRRALRDFQDFADDVSRSRYRTFSDAIRRLASTLVPGTPLGDVAEQLPLVHFAEWYQLQLKSVGSMAGSGILVWPDDRLQRLALQVALVRDLAGARLDIGDFAQNFFYVSNRYDDNIAEFVQQIFRPFVRDFLKLAHDMRAFSEGLRRGESDDEEGAPMPHNPTLFISHSADDASIAKALVTLFEKALKVSARHIRCTSVDGYRIPVGADTNEVLRTEVFGAGVLVAMLTPHSLSSHYVLFELGARWGARRPLFPILAGGAEAGDLRAPLSGLNALSVTSADQVRQLLEDTVAALSLPLEPMASYSKEIENLVIAASPTTPSAGTS